MAKALIIGIDSYPKRNYNVYGGMDALSFANTLLSTRKTIFNRNNTRVLLNDRANSLEIADRLKWLKDVKSDDFYILYFSGVGTEFFTRDSTGNVKSEHTKAIVPYDLSYADEATHILTDYILSPVEFQGNGLIIFDCLFDYSGYYDSATSNVVANLDELVDSTRAKVMLPTGDILFRNNTTATKVIEWVVPARKLLLCPGGKKPRLEAKGLTSGRSGSVFTQAIIESWEQLPNSSYINIYRDQTKWLKDNGVDSFTPRIISGQSFDMSKQFCTIK